MRKRNKWNGLKLAAEAEEDDEADPDEDEVRAFDINAAPCGSQCMSSLLNLISGKLPMSVVIQVPRNSISLSQVLSDHQLKQMIEQDKMLDELLNMRIGNGSGANAATSTSSSSSSISSTTNSESSTIAAAAALTAVGTSVMMPPKPRVQARRTVDPDSRLHLFCLSHSSST